MQLQKKSRMLNGRELSTYYVVYKCGGKRPLPKRLYLGLADREWKSRFYNTSYHVNTRDIPIRQHSEVKCS